ncbi:hypothetical protein SEA_SKINNYPETE_48 [Mycobacterium phage SkinnyPete]|uniref:RusA-like resolvase n=1 Tax=Mycobacterium phage SkinnyPete TaxID=1821539 RepID=A0A142UM69_9CAUD|nr:RusA-like Holliday junction resolvase [Mycobacterium phage SkinnyPete]AMU78478.1 hypothetical protein SEA_SKINNYPETE_48 [Mycobacterium phage SkinnyPete]
MTAPFEVRIDLPWSRPPLTANQRMHWAAKAKTTREVRAAAAVIARNLPRADRLVVTLHYQPSQNRRRDRHNLWPTVKALVDGLVDAGVVPDDDTEHVSTPEPVIHTPASTAALWLVLHYPTTEVS